MLYKIIENKEFESKGRFKYYSYKSQHANWWILYRRVTIFRWNTQNKLNNRNGVPWSGEYLTKIPNNCETCDYKIEKNEHLSSKNWGKFPL